MNQHILLARLAGLAGAFLARQGLTGAAFGSVPKLVDYLLFLLGAVMGLLLFAGTGE